MNHTLEHMDKPGEILDRAHKILKKNGILFVDVPNAAGFGARILGEHWPYLLPDEHKHQFTKQSLEKLFKLGGFKVMYWESRSGIFEFAEPFTELFESLFSFKKRFFTNLITIPYSIFVTLWNSGDSMSLIGKKF